MRHRHDQHEEAALLAEESRSDGTRAATSKPAPLSVESKTVPQQADQAASYHFVWLVLAVLSHVGWGLHPVFARYLQKYAHPPLGALQLLFLISFISE